MAKRRGRRDHSPIANQPLSVLTPRYTVTPLRLIEDRRLYHPDGPYQPVRTVSGGVSHITTEENRNVQRGSRQDRRRNGPSSKQTKARLVFADDPVGSRAIVCVRRETRREVLFAKGYGGSKKRRRKVRRGATSSVGC